MVIAILAAISVAAYTNIQDRARISEVNANLNQINKAVKAYRAINGKYPDTSRVWRSQSDANQNTFIPGLVPSVISSIPRANASWNGTPTFYYISDGTDYQLLYLYPSTQTIPSAAASNSTIQSMLAPGRTSRGWGYSTPGAVGW